MELTGEQLIPAPRQAVWDAINDPEILRQCITGCESVTKTSDTDFEASVQVKVGPVKARFKGKVTLSDLDPPNSCTISGEAQGGVAAGFGKGSAKVQLADAENGATRFVPGSHQSQRDPSDFMSEPTRPHEGEVLACGPAGSIIVFNGSVWHSHTANRSRHRRRSLQGHFIPRSARSSVDHSRRIRPEVLDRIGSFAKYILAVG